MADKKKKNKQIKKANQIKTIKKVLQYLESTGFSLSFPFCWRL